MLEDISELENTISKLERTAPKLAEVSFFERVLSLRENIMTHWPETQPEEVDTVQSLALRDRIIFLEQRIFDLASRVPAYTPRDVRLKMKFLMLELGITENPSGHEGISETLIKSIFRDLTHFANENDPSSRQVEPAKVG